MRKNCFGIFKNQLFFVSMPIDQQLTADSINLKIKSAAQKLEGTNGFFLKHLYAFDPLGLTFKKLESLKPEQGKGSYVVKDGLIYTKDEQKIIFFATVAIDSKDIAQLTKLNEKLTLQRLVIRADLCSFNE